DGSVASVAGEIGQLIAVAHAEVQEQQRVIALGEFGRRCERLAVKLLPRHAKGLEAAVDEPPCGVGGRAKEHVERTVHVPDVRDFQVKVELSIQKYTGALAALGNGEVMPMVIKLDRVAALASPNEFWAAIVERDSEVHPIVLRNPQHPAVCLLDVAADHGPRPDLVTG